MLDHPDSGYRLKFRYGWGLPWSLALSLVLALGLPRGAAADVGYRLTDLGTLGGTDSVARGINDAGQVTGFSLTLTPDPDASVANGPYSSCSASGYTQKFLMSTYRHAFLHSPGGSMIDLGTLGGNTSEGYVTSDSGAVAGKADTPTESHTFLYSGGVMSDLDTPPPEPGFYVSVVAINSANEVLGFYDKLYLHGVVYTGGSFEIIPPLDPSTSVAPFAIDDSSLVYAIGTVGGASHIIAYQAGVTSDLYVLPDGFSQLVGGNSVGEAIISEIVDGVGHWAIFSAGTVTFIEFPDGSSYRFPLAISNAGQVVGFFSPAGSQASHGFLSDGVTFQDLNDLVLNPSGIVVAKASAINEAGQIAGCGWDGVHAHAIRLDPIDPSLCGNGILDFGEQCDDGNSVDGDGCDSNCTPTGCGNGVTTSGEECDDGNSSNGDGCSVTCQIDFAACGNLFLDPGEECDDGNFADGDGCDSDCTPTACGNAIVTAGEQCDDGNVTDGDGCDSTCQLEAPALCGNTAIDPGETCDDGNTTGGDGCSSSCQLESYPDVRGTWQVTFDYAAVNATATRFIDITEENLSSGIFRAVLGFSCGSDGTSIGGSGYMYPNSDCSFWPQTITGALRGALGLTLDLPSAGSFLSEDTVATPFQALTCSSVARTKIALGLTGALTTDSGEVTRIDGSGTALADLEDPSGNVCFSGGTNPTFVMLRNDVPTGSDVTAQPVDGATVTFQDVATDGSVGVVLLTDASATVPANFSLSNGTFADVITDADISGGTVLTCLSYPDLDADGFVDDTSPPLPEGELQILHAEDGTFVDRTVSRDPTNDVICAETSSLSQFALGSGAPQAPVGCPSAPDPGCVSGFAGQFLIKESKPGKEKLSAKLLGGPGLAQTDFGNPLDSSGTTYALCLYDGDGVSVGMLGVPPGAPPGSACTYPTGCWKTLGHAPPDGLGYKFRDKNAASDGLVTILLKGGAAGKARVKFKGKNNAAKGQTALPTGIAQALSTTASLTIQLRSSDASCFSATLSDIIKQETFLFKAK